MYVNKFNTILTTVKKEEKREVIKFIAKQTLFIAIVEVSAKGTE